MQVVERILCKVLWAHLQTLGFFKEKTFTFDKDAQSRLHGFYNKWFEQTLNILRQHGYLTYDGESYGVVHLEPINGEELWKQWDQEKDLWLEDRNLKAMLALVEATLKALPEILIGNVLATDILFPNSSMERVEGVYKDNDVADYFNELLAHVLITYIQERLKQEPNVKINILEIGAGTGGTSATVFQRLKPFQQHIQEYCYTDVSKAFLLHAKKEYGSENPFLKYALFDVEASVIEQGITPSNYDVVIAANVLHATKNIRQTLRNAKAALKKRGVLLLNEISNYNLFSHLTFGLLEGWWLYEDPEWRIPGCPGLYPDKWKRVLECEGFSTVLLVKADKQGQQIIAAESDGVVRQQRVVSKSISLGSPPPKQAPQINRKSEIKSSLIEKTLQYIKATLAKTLHLAPERIEINTTFEKYGIDSILQVSFIQELEKITGELPKTLLFEYSTASELADYLIKHHAHQLDQQMGKDTPKQEKKADPSIWNSEHKRFQPTFFQKKLDSEDIAIIGISGRYPLAPNLDILWTNLTAGRNCLTEIPYSRKNLSSTQLLPTGSFGQKSKTYYGGFLEQIDRFDHHLFAVDQQRVMEMSPEWRLFLEVVWETFENAGYSRSALSALQKRELVGIGVFVGNMYNQYFWNIPSPKEAVLSSVGTDWHLANRVSHFFNLTGPSLAINTACSSSLYALHLACESLKQKSCSMALIGGVNLTLNPSKYDLLEQAHFLGSGNESKSFGAGDGLIPGEGVGAALLKPLSRALEDRDPIKGIIKSSFVNHSGGRQMYTVPNPEQQARLILYSMEKSGIEPTTIGYIESAANGSPLGDPIEVAALNRAFSSRTDRKNFCALGSIKSNLGHLEAASGIAQLHKVILQMNHKTLVPTLHTNPINPNIKLENTAFYLQQTKKPWERLHNSQGGKECFRRSMINSFGAGGSYANAIIEEYEGYVPSKNMHKPLDGALLFIFSAKTCWSLVKYLEKIQNLLEQDPSLQLSDLAYSLHKINHALENRVALIASNRSELLEKLEQFQRSQTSAPNLQIFTSIDHLSASNRIDESMCSSLLDQKQIEHLALHWISGLDIDFSKLYDDNRFFWRTLPSYAFDHQIAFNFHNDLSVPSEIYDYEESFVQGHRINGKPVLVGAVFASLAFKAFFHLLPNATIAKMRKLNYLLPVEIEPNQPAEIKINPTLADEGIDFQIICRHHSSNTWQVIATGQVRKAIIEQKCIDLDSLKSPLEPFYDLDLIYSNSRGGVEWGDIFKTITHLYRGNDRLLAKISLDRFKRQEKHIFELDPILTNSIYIATLYLTENLNIRDSFLPFSIQEIMINEINAFNECWLDVRFVKQSRELLVFDVDVIDNQFRVVLQYKGYSLKRNHQPIPQSNDLFGTIQNYLKKAIYTRTGNTENVSYADVNFMDCLSSSQLIALTNEIEREAKIDLNPTLFFEYPTLNELAYFLSQEHKEAFTNLLGNQLANNHDDIFSDQKDKSISHKDDIQKIPLTKMSETLQKTLGRLTFEKDLYPELISLNQKEKGIPIFWFHGGFGGVEIYHPVAKAVQRPFFGIKARGHETSHFPLYRIEEMALYYLEIIRATQPKGPYDLGGFSLGGLLAYEVTRRLQMMGETVKSIVMIDAPDHTKFYAKRPSLKTLMLQTVNSLLKPESVLISREELDLQMDDESFWQGLVARAQERGLTQTEKRMRFHVEQHVKIQHAYQFDDYRILSLLEPQEPICYYFRNKNGLFLGDLKPYFTTPQDEVSFDHTAYWQEWALQFTHFHMTDIKASNHMVLLSESEPCQIIVEFCSQLYSQNEIPHNV